MNHVSLLGRLTKDPEVRTTQGGTAWARFLVAVNRRMSVEKKKEAEAKGQPTADFISCVAWGNTAELVERSFKKGDLILLEGRISTGNYERDGQRVYTTDVTVERLHFLPKREENHASFTKEQRQGSFYPVDQDEIPFI